MGLSTAGQLQQSVIYLNDNFARRAGIHRAHRTVQFARKQNGQLFRVQMNQCFAADCLTKANIVGLLERPVRRDRQTFVTGTDYLNARRDNMNINILTMKFRALLRQRARLALDDGKEQVIAIDRIFARRQGVGILLRNGL